MTGIRRGRQMAQIEGDFVVFIIGYRPTWARLQHTWGDLGGRRGMFRMLKELSDNPESGLLGYERSTFGGIIIQYWRSFDHLERFANDNSDLHVAAWRDYWRRVGTEEGTGIWHETYLVRAGEYEAVYANMPPFGLGKVSTLVPYDQVSARQRLGAARSTR